VAGYLPQYWDQHLSSEDVTFHGLLRDESGFGWILNPSRDAPDRLRHARPDRDVSRTEYTLWHAVSASVYRNFVNERIFAAAGIGPFDFTAGPDAARAYGRPPSPPGAQLADVTSDAGSSGWHLSLSDLMRVIAGFRHGSTMMTPGQAQQALADRYRLDHPIVDTSAGAIYVKRGRYNDGGSNTLDVGVTSCPTTWSPASSSIRVRVRVQRSLATTTRSPS
jgi:hypothetical protein